MYGRVAAPTPGLHFDAKMDSDLDPRKFFPVFNGVAILID